MTTVIGPVKFRPDGTGIVQAAFAQWQNGKQELVWPKEFATAPLAYPGAAVRQALSVARSSPAACPFSRWQRVSKGFGGVRAVHDVSFTLDGGRAARRHGPERLGQDHALQPDRRRAAPRTPATIRLRGARRSRGCAPHRVCARGIARTFQLVPPVRRPDRAARTCWSAASTAATARRRRRDGRGRAAARAGRAGGPGATCPAASSRSSTASGSSWPARWPPAPSCCCSTSSWPGSTRRDRRRRWRSSDRCRPGASPC